MSQLPAGWTVASSRSTGAQYYFNAARNQSLWIDASLPAGWGWRQAAADAPRLYVHLASGVEQEAKPSFEVPRTALAAEAPPAAPATAAAASAAPLASSSSSTAPPPPSAATVAFDVFNGAFRSREPWTARQLGFAAAAEAAWWAAVAAGGSAAGVALPACAPAEHGAAAAAAGDAAAPTLIAAVLAALGEARLAATWDARARRYVVRREDAPGFAAGGGGAQSSGAKRARSSEELPPPPPPPPAPPPAAAAAAAAAAPPPLTFRPASAFPRLSGAELFLSPAFHSSPAIAEIYISGRVTTAAGEVRRISAAVGPKESRHLYSLVRDNCAALRRVLEVGCANGLSALAICQALEDGGAPPAGQLTSIDPFQSTQWAGTALANLARAGLAHRHRLLEEKSYAALPALLAAVRAGEEQPFDAVFVDGMHLFDYTLVDLFYADLLLREGGVLLLDDVRHRGVAPCYEYVVTNWKHYRLVGDTVCADTLATFVKLGADSRSWDAHVPFSGGR